MALQTLHSQQLKDRASTITAQLQKFHDTLAPDAALAKLVPFSIQFGSERGNYSIDDIAISLWFHWTSSAPSYDVEYWKSEVRTMIEFGSRYRNLDAHLGYGASLVLGTTLSETMWTKVLPKSGKRFERVVEHLRQAGIPGIAMEMRSTFEKVIEYEMVRLRTLFAEQASIIEQNATSEVVVGVENAWSYPLDASLGEAGINVSTPWASDGAWGNWVTDSREQVFWTY